MHMTRVTNGVFSGPCGQIEYLLSEPEAANSTTPNAVLCHPHPLFGGTMHSRTVYWIAQALAESGHRVLRFNFRGVGNSAGNYDEGRGERGDVGAAMDFMFDNWGGPILLAGFSFGAIVALYWLGEHNDRRVQQYLGAGFPAHPPHAQATGQYAEARRIVRLTPPERLAWNGPKLFISGELDAFADPGALETYTASLEPPTQVIRIAGADHFFSAHKEALQQAIRSHSEGI